MRAKYSPMIPRIRSCTPEKIAMMDAETGIPELFSRGEASDHHKDKDDGAEYREEKPDQARDT